MKFLLTNIDQMDLLELRNLGSTIGDTTRMVILYELGDGPKSVGQLAAKIGRSSATVSFHVSKLLNVGLVRVRRNGRRTLVQRDYWTWRKVVQAFA